MRQDQYREVLQNRLLPQLSEWFPDGDCTFMQDGAPCHTAKSVMAFLRERNVRVLAWPGNSPDQNPIENIWMIVKKRVANLQPTTKAQLIAAILNVWHHDPDVHEICVAATASMTTRVRGLLDAKGLWTKCRTPRLR